jgi:EAL domain-containing protein (putative c-di-GMP-specific phosphodiesterase class I)
MKEMGIAILVDDFGTGYSSMSYLQRFPIDTLKIDRSFVTLLDKHANRVIVRTIVNLAHSLGLSVVAEGIETESQYLALREMGCEFAQGSHFSRPIPPRPSRRVHHSAPEKIRALPSRHGSALCASIAP